jgi:hypothetical protein
MSVAWGIPFTAKKEFVTRWKDTDYPFLAIKFSNVGP